MKNIIPTLAFLFVFFVVFNKVLRGFAANDFTLGAWIVGIAAALLLSVAAAEIAFAVAKKGVAVCRWLRLKAKRLQIND